MGVRLQSTFYSERQHEYTISIYDSLYVDTPLEFECVDCVIRYDFDGDEDDRFSPIVSSQATVNIIINTTALNTFTEDLLNAPEDRFYILIEDDDTPTEFRWVGYIVPDLVVQQDTTLDIGYEFQLTAKDGFNWLKTADYSNGLNEYTGYATLLEHILNALDKLPFLDEIYGSSNTYIKFLMTWYERNMTTGIIGAYNPLNHLRIHHKAFKWKDSKGNVHYRSCYDVLKYIAIAFGGRWIFSGRYVYFVQINEYDTAEASKPWWNIINDQNIAIYNLFGEQLVIENNQSTLNDTEIIREGGGVFKYLPALKEVKVKYEHIGTRNLLAGEEFTDQIDPSLQRKILSDLDPTLTEAFLTIRYTLNYDSKYLINSAHTAHYLVFGFKIIDAGLTEFDFPTRNEGTYKREVIFDTNGNYVYQPAEWTTDQNNYYKIVVPVQYADQRYVVTDSFIVDNLPYALGYGLEFYLLGAYTLDGFPLSLGKLETNYRVDTLYGEYVSLQFFGEQNDILEYKAVNDEYATKKYETTSILGDGPNLNSPGRIDVWNGTEWVTSSSAANLKWSSPKISEKNISQLLANEIISTQLSPVKYFADMSFIVKNASAKFLLPHYAIKYDGEYWVFQGGEIVLFEDRVKGNWWKINFEE